MAFFDPDSPILHVPEEIETFFLRARPFVDAPPATAEILQFSSPLDDFEKLAAAAGEEGAAAEILATLGGNLPAHALVLPNGWVILLRHVEEGGAAFNILVDTSAKNIAKPLAYLLRGLNDLDVNRTGIPLPPPNEMRWPDIGVTRDEVEKEFKTCIEHRKDAGEAARRKPSRMIDSYLHWFATRHSQLQPATRRTTRAAQRDTLRAAERVDLRLHVINTRYGNLSDSGEFHTDPSDVSLIAQTVNKWLKGKNGRRLMLYAHGGLSNEDVAIRYAQNTARWWLDNDVYPIFSVWESGAIAAILEAISAMLGFPRIRGVLDGTAELSDTLVESLVRNLGGPGVWDSMKRSAAHASADGPRCGLTLLAKELKAAKVTVPLHLVGHSAGAIMQLNFLTRLKAEGLKAASLQMLAPAATTALVHETLAAYGSLPCHIYALTDRLERDDTTGPYWKSLLYLVNRGFEPDGAPIAGMQKHLLADRALVAQLTIAAGGSTRETLVFSETTDGTPRRLASRARQHGGFDNDAATMWSVMRFIRGQEEEAQIPTFPEEQSKRGLEAESPVAGYIRTYRQIFGGQATSAVSGAAAVPAPLPAQARASARRALTIGIDAYGGRFRLAGCVGDSTTWRSLLEARGFDVTQLIRPEETGRTQILETLRSFIGTAGAGDTLVWHYSGHGAQIAPQQSYEMDDERTGFNQSIIFSNDATEVDAL